MSGLSTVAPAFQNRWRGETVCVVGSGPSLTVADCAAVVDAGLKTIAVNNAWQYLSRCDVLYAADAKWWQAYAAGIGITAELWTSHKTTAARLGINLHEFIVGYNSGLQAIFLAAAFGAARILLLGFDLQLTDKRTHFHGDHAAQVNGAPLGNPDRAKCRTWRGQFEKSAPRFQGIDIINCSRETALKTFPRRPLEEVLWPSKQN